MTYRRDLLASSLYVASIGACAGCINSAEDSPDQTAGKNTTHSQIPDSENFHFQAVPREAPFPHSEEDYSDEFVWIQNLSNSNASFTNMVIQYPNGLQYQLGQERSLDLPPQSQLFVFSDDRRPVKLLVHPPIFKIGADLRDRPLLDDSSTVQLLAPDGETIMTTNR